MALEDIIKEIEKEKEERLKEIDKEKEKEISELKERYERELREKREEILKGAQEELKKKILRTEEELKRKREILILEEKRKLLEKVQKIAFEEIKGLDEETEKEVLEKLVKKVSLETKGISDSELEIISACQKEELLRKVLKKSQKEYQFSSNCLKSSGGFVLRTKNFEINCTLESLFDKIKDETEIKIAKILFEPH
jgi:vacuolar-type H+-ATPase subunit E/Vma4